MYLDKTIPKSIGSYKVLEFIGEGAYGDVFKAESIFLSYPVSIKRILKSKIPDERSLKRLNREARVISEISHPNIIRFVEYLCDDHFYYIVTEYFPGSNLLTYAKSQNEADYSTIRYILKQILLALSYLHSNGVCHRDLKLENIIIDEKKFIKLIDFGLCGFDTPFNPQDTFCGSHMYASPEILSSKPYNGAKSDMWSLGVVLFALIVRKLPWGDHNLPQSIKRIINGHYNIPITIDSNASDLIKSLLNIVPEERPTASQALFHPFFQNGKITEPTLLSKKPRDLVNQRCLMHWKTANHTTNEECRKLTGKRHIFSSLKILVPTSMSYSNPPKPNSKLSSSSSLISRICIDSNA